MAITFTSKGDFKNTEKLFKKSNKVLDIDVLEKYGRIGVSVLRDTTPKDSGLTASSWSYKITRTKNTTTIAYYNSAMTDGVPIAILLQYGHATKNGGFVQGIDFINPSIKPIFEAIAKDAWKEVTGS